jgi:hypothetical protein
MSPAGAGHHPLSAACYEARSLADLRDALQRYSDHLAALHEDGEHAAAGALAADLHPAWLPAFGGDMPSAADAEAASWDETHVLIRDEDGTWLVEPRAPRCEGPGEMRIGGVP